MIKIIILILLLGSPWFCNQLHSQSRYNIIYEPNLGMNYGAENIVSSHYLLSQIDNRFIPNEIFKKEGFSSTVGNIAYRLTKVFLIDYPITFVLPTLQHERFGHGTRVLEFGGEIKEVYTPFPPPFQSELPFMAPSFYGMQTSHQDIMVFSSGSEANAVMGNILRKNILLDEDLDYHNALLYLYSNNDLSGYAIFASDIPGGSDLTSYLTTINNLNTNENLTIEKIQLYGALSILLDPINYYSFNSLFNGYIWKGENKSDIYLININEDLKYLPKLNFSLTPFGPELTLQNYFKLGDKLYSFSLGSSDKTFENYLRFKVAFWNVKFGNKFSLNFCSEIWNQPTTEFFVENQLESSSGIGGLFLGTFNYDVYSNGNRLGFTLQLGYKSSGFAQGEQLYKGIISRGGLTFKLGSKSQ